MHYFLFPISLQGGPKNQATTKLSMNHIKSY